MSQQEKDPGHVWFGQENRKEKGGESEREVCGGLSTSLALSSGVGSREKRRKGATLFVHGECARDLSLQVVEIRNTL